MREDHLVNSTRIDAGSFEVAPQFAAVGMKRSPEPMSTNQVGRVRISVTFVGELYSFQVGPLLSRQRLPVHRVCLVPKKVTGSTDGRC